MKKRARLTPFAKIVILVLVVLVGRYAYLHKDEIVSGEFFNFSDTTKVEKDTSLITDSVLIDSISQSLDTSKMPELIADSLNLQMLRADTVTIIVEKKDDVLSIITSNKSINILLSDSVLVSDTLFFLIPKGEQNVGRIIIK